MNNNRFIMYKNDVKSFNKKNMSDKQILKILKGKIEEIKNLNVGDIVVLKELGDIVTIVANNGEIYTYKGSIEGYENLILFDDEDVERVLNRKR